MFQHHGQLTGRLTAENVHWEAVTASGGGSNMLTVAGCPLWAVVHFPVTWGSLWLDLKIRSRNKATDFSQLSDTCFFFLHFYILCVVGFCGIFKEAFLKEDKVQKQVRKLELFQQPTGEVVCIPERQWLWQNRNIWPVEMRTGCKYRCFCQSWQVSTD